MKRASSPPQTLFKFRPEARWGNLSIHRLAWSPESTRLAWLGTVWNSGGINWPLFVTDVADVNPRHVATAASFAWGPEGHLYYLHIPESVPDEPPPSQTAEIFWLDPAIDLPTSTLRAQLAGGEAIADVLAVSHSSFYFVTFSEPSKWTRDQVMSYDRSSGKTGLLYQAPSGFYVEDMTLANTAYFR